MSTEKTVLNHSRSVQNSRRRKALALVRETALEGDHQERPEDDEDRGEQTSRSYQREGPGAQQISHPPAGPPGRRLDVGPPAA